MCAFLNFKCFLLWIHKDKKQKNSLKLIGNIVKNIKENFTKKWYKKLLKSVDIFRKTCYNVEKF